MLELKDIRKERAIKALEEVGLKDQIKVTDCTDIETDTIMQEYYEYLAS